MDCHYDEDPVTREPITEMGASKTYCDQETNTKAIDLPSI